MTAAKKKSSTSSAKKKSSTPAEPPPADDKPAESPEPGETAKKAKTDAQGRPPTHDQYGETHDDAGGEG